MLLAEDLLHGHEFENVEKALTDPPLDLILLTLRQQMIEQLYLHFINYFICEISGISVLFCRIKLILKLFKWFFRIFVSVFFITGIRGNIQALIGKSKRQFLLRKWRLNPFLN